MDDLGLNFLRFYKMGKIDLSINVCVVDKKLIIIKNINVNIWKYINNKKNKITILKTIQLIKCL